MKFIRFIVSGGLTYLLIFFLNNNFGSMPAIGPLADPAKGFMANASNDSDYELMVLTKSVSDSVSIYFDKRRVPHIFASNEADLYFAQGYITASMRLWQMEMTAFAASGRVSEKLGPDFLEYDRLQRRMGMLESAQLAESNFDWESPTGVAVKSYADGVNSYIKQLKPSTTPLEYKLMGFEPEEWSTLKTFLLLKYMAKTLTAYDDDAALTNIQNMLPTEDFEKLFPERYNDIDPIIPKGTYSEGLNKIDSFITNPINASFSTNTLHQSGKDLDGKGSNNWAIAAEKSASGNPILCNDPHLPLNLPSLWFEIQLHAPGLNTYGASLPGSPCVILGFNKDVAWGVTNAGWDVRDWYMLDINDELEYLYDGERKPLLSRVETIKIKDGQDFLDTIYSSHQGPLVYYNFDSTYSSWNHLAMKWAANSPSNELRTFYLLNKASTLSDYLEATRTFACPAQNIVFASRDNDIALRVSGKFPLRPEGHGRTILDGSNSKNDWKETIPWKDNPIVINPERLFVSSANQHATDSLYPHYYTGFDFEHYRNRRINSLLSEGNEWTVDDMKSLQQDDYNMIASEALPKMLEGLNKDVLSKSENENLLLLAKWDYHNSINSQAAGLFQKWWDAFIILYWDEFNENLSVNMIYPEEAITVEALNWPNDDIYFDNKTTPKKETKNDILVASYKDASKAIDSLRNINPESIKWFNIKATKAKHLASLDAFSRSNIPVSGNKHIVNATTSTNGPSWRMIVELGDRPTAEVIYPGGQSGNPGSRHYDDFIDDWATGNYYSAKFYFNIDEAAGDLINNQNNAK